ncbi:PREDICTED: venom serine protease-like [Nicrophorus vespilloides]|uniref:Venom serine protease-like n=1 Tax=Nicrophorus vespilloides TaxID=110193 RepID=A0ABM1MI22_NICVS|nr:PREDICTED: venom serine protease-like [Nicrophorus vespilloides]
METNYAALYNIKQIITNDQYDAHLTLYDVSLVKTTKQIIFNIAVGPVCLPFRYSQNDFAGQLVTILGNFLKYTQMFGRLIARVSGWGTTEFSGPVSEHLRKTNVTVYSNFECQPQISSKLLSNQLCTSSIKTDSCQYDSGGPVIFADSLTRRDFLIGSISSGRGCAGGIPSINSRITSFLQWIVDVTPGKYKDCYALSDTCHYLATCIKI